MRTQVRIILASEAPPITGEQLNKHLRKYQWTMPSHVEAQGRPTGVTKRTLIDNDVDERAAGLAADLGWSKAEVLGAWAALSGIPITGFASFDGDWSKVRMHEDDPKWSDPVTPTQPTATVDRPSFTAWDVLPPDVRALWERADRGPGRAWCIYNVRRFKKPRLTRATRLGEDRVVAQSMGTTTLLTIDEVETLVREVGGWQSLADGHIQFNVECAAWLYAHCNGWTIPTPVVFRDVRNLCIGVEHMRDIWDKGWRTTSERINVREHAARAKQRAIRRRRASKAQFRKETRDIRAIDRWTEIDEIRLQESIAPGVWIRNMLCWLSTHYDSEEGAAYVSDLLGVPTDAVLQWRRGAVSSIPMFHMNRLLDMLFLADARSGLLRTPETLSLPRVRDDGSIFHDATVGYVLPRITRLFRKPWEATVWEAKRICIETDTSYVASYAAAWIERLTPGVAWVDGAENYGRPPRVTAAEWIENPEERELPQERGAVVRLLGGVEAALDLAVSSGTVVGSPMWFKAALRLLGRGQDGCLGMI